MYSFSRSRAAIMISNALTAAVRPLVVAAVMAVGFAGAAAAQEVSTTVVVASDTLPNLGEAVTFTATVTSAGSVVGGLGVTFFDGGTTLDTVLVEADGTASLTTSTLTLGPHHITAAFNGTLEASASSNTVDITVIAATSTTVVTATPNPGTTGQPITLTATVTSAAGDVTGGLGVTFFDGADLLDTVPVAADGTATLTVPFAIWGSRTITAAFNGTSSVGASNGTTTLVVNAAESINVRAMQVLATPVVAAISGRAFSDAVNGAIAAGFAGGDETELGPEGIGITRDLGGTQIWANLRFTGTGSWGPLGTEGVLAGRQFNGLGGVTFEVTPNVVFGIVGGYENFAYRSDDLDADLDGGGWTAGGYFGARLGETLRFNAAVGYSGIGYNVQSGPAAASFSAGRVVATMGLNGAIEGDRFVLTPSVDAFGVWEYQEGYTDTLGMVQDARSFMTGRVSAGIKVGLPIATGGVTILPYAGLYADFAVGEEGAELAELGLVSPLGGTASARATGGFSLAIGDHATIDLGATYDGLGRPVQSFGVTGGLNVAF